MRAYRCLQFTPASAMNFEMSWVIGLESIVQVWDGIQCHVGYVNGGQYSCMNVTADKKQNVDDWR